MFDKSHARHGSGDKTLRLWALADGTCLKTFEGHTASVLRLNFLSAGTQVSTACNACFYDSQFAETQQTLYLGCMSTAVLMVLMSASSSKMTCKARSHGCQFAGIQT